MIAASASVAVAQASTPRCATGPGSLFGIQAYQCANCGFKYENGKRTQYTFFAEPTVTQVERTSNVQVGDVIEAVDGRPITTDGGSEQFTYPATGEHTLTVRRGRERQEIRMKLETSCYASTTVGGGAGFGGSATTASGGRPSSVTRPPGTASGGSGSGGSGANVTTAAEVRVVDALSGRAISSATTWAERVNSSTGKFGFGIECEPSCSMKRQPSGDFHYKYDGYPRIVAVVRGTAADRAHLEVGDHIVKVNGRSILEESGVLERAEQQNEIRMTVRRDGKDIDVVMVVTP
jgi:S1-C subfamily serine protease